jgi:hypothetical protein
VTGRSALEIRVEIFNLLDTPPFAPPPSSAPPARLDHLGR